ncbi:myo-inosose-2 dehydratase [Pararhizobium sp. YC-54]|uniref:myo-inosose-2 dehydratase n=1 Tax=Pararhizobium sp. YC-54 TaxID=2986920 RepID=UPI0021F78C2E|nr:myo-inosose-2 dehydratase [Pararhizobium sp. YC-54]MCW0001389.1 myo-inosose-2 dehydratase [Pararhizobium sp. YC-54]
MTDSTESTLPPGVSLGVSPLSWTNDVLEDLGDDIPLETCLEEARSAGYAGVELGRKFPRAATVLGPILERHDLRLASGWYSGFLADRDVDLELIEVHEHASLLRDLGARIMVYGECGRMYPEEPLDAPMSKRLTLAPTEIVPYAAKLTDFSRRLKDAYGLTLAYHHHLMMVAETFDEISAIFDATGPEVGLLLDTGHARAAGFDFVRLIKRFADRIVHIHLKDVRAEVLARVRDGDMSFNDGVRAGMFTVPGDGDVDFDPVFQFVRKGGYKGWIVVEAEQDPSIAPPKPAVGRAHRYLSGRFLLRNER